METKSTDQATPEQALGRIQVSAQRNRRFYVYAARRQFAAKPNAPQTITITALGSAVTSAIAIAHELESMQVSSITAVKTFYAPVESGPTPTSPTGQQQQDATTGTKPTGPRNVARIAITVTRNPNWKPESTDEMVRPPRREPRKSAEGAANGSPAQEQQ